MTDLATAMTDVSALTPFDGRPVVRTTVAIVGAGDGLSQALAVDPVELHHGQRVVVVLECEVTRVSFVPVKDSDALVRIHTLRAGGATMIENEVVDDHLAEQADRIQQAQEQAKGIQRITDYIEDET